MLILGSVIGPRPLAEVTARWGCKPSRSGNHLGGSLLGASHVGAGALLIRSSTSNEKVGGEED